MQERNKAVAARAWMRKRWSEPMNCDYCSCEGETHEERCEIGAIIKADEQASALPAAEREQLARDLYERVADRSNGDEPITWEQQGSSAKTLYRTIVDIIGEIERERHPPKGGAS